MILLGCYGKDDCADPGVFVSAAVHVFTHYPEEIVLRVTNPHSGLPGTLKWFPKIFEIREACDAATLAARRVEERQARLVEQFAERERLQALDRDEGHREKIRRGMEKLTAGFVAASPSKPPPIDIRKMEDCEQKEALRRRLDAEAKRLKAKLKSETIAPLSPAALKLFGDELPPLEASP